MTGSTNVKIKANKIVCTDPLGLHLLVCWINRCLIIDPLVFYRLWDFLWWRLQMHVLCLDD